MNHLNGEKQELEKQPKMIESILNVMDHVCKFKLKVDFMQKFCKKDRERRML